MVNGYFLTKSYREETNYLNNQSPQYTIVFKLQYTGFINGYLLKFYYILIGLQSIIIYYLEIEYTKLNFTILL